MVTIEDFDYAEVFGTTENAGVEKVKRGGVETGWEENAASDYT